MVDLTDAQRRILTAGAQRDSSLAIPLPKGLHGAVAKKVVGMLVERGLLEEVDANIRKNEPLWRETGDGHGTTLVVTKAGLAAIGVESVVVKTMARVRKAAKTPKTPPATKTPRTGTKQAKLIAMLEAQGGASIAEIIAATGWQTHTIRGAISGVLKKKLGLSVISEKVEGRGRVYNITS
ncbi:MAG: DUF3489 domain-containing protein [Rhodobacteraceae bacterium]|nr:DUF3489 domain-containing protein [Paracoccaceae bacterium]